MLRYVTFAALLPVLVPQALWVVSRAVRLPEADGPRSGAIGQGRPLNLLILGDSSAAGVGVDHQDQALAGQLAQHLSQTGQITWTLIAQTGATTDTALRMLETAPKQHFDMAVIALGVNDCKNGISANRWQTNYTTILDHLRDRFRVRRICVSGVPDLGQFPLLPKPLGTILGNRAHRFDAILHDIVDARADVTYVSLDFGDDTTLMARDGFHPGPLIYTAWAKRVAETFR
ncbi:MAG: SGNH/GDSL hydrolase family protein [Paracoccaceae bacterium]